MTRSQRANGRPDTEALREEIMQTRAELGETLQALAARADVPARLRQSASQTAHRLGDSASQTTHQLRDSATRTAGTMKQAVVREASRRPVPWAAVGLGAAAAAVAVVLVLRGRRR